MNFGQAIEALKDGKKVARQGWNVKGMWLRYVPQGCWTTLVEIAGPNNLSPWIGMQTTDKKFVPWLASQTDVLAEDWGIIE